MRAAAARIAIRSRISETRRERFAGKFSSPAILAGKSLREAAEGAGSAKAVT